LLQNGFLNTQYNRLSNRLYNRFDNWLYRVNKHQAGVKPVVKLVAGLTTVLNEQPVFEQPVLFNWLSNQVVQPV